jgi:hypothetical protein
MQEDASVLGMQEAAPVLSMQEDAPVLGMQEDAGCSRSARKVSRGMMEASIWLRRRGMMNEV